MTPSEAVQKLVIRGMSEAAIGEAVGAGQSTINRIRRGDTKSPSWDVGQKLIALAKRKGRCNA